MIVFSDIWRSLVRIDGNSSNFAPNRDIGYELFGTLASGAIQYQLAELDGSYDEQSLNNPTDNRKDVAYRLFANPFALTDFVWLKGFGIGYLRHDGPEHVLCFAPIRSGKGVGLVVPTLLT